MAPQCTEKTIKLNKKANNASQFLHLNLCNQGIGKKLEYMKQNHNTKYINCKTDKLLTHFMSHTR